MRGVYIKYRPIGIIHSEHHIARETPIQPVYAKGCNGRVEIFQEFAEGIDSLSGFSHIYLLYHFHKADPVKIKVKPFLQDIERGIFATRAPCRPNSIGLSTVELIRVDQNMLYVDGLDILDNTPLLDIKPYTEKFDRFITVRNGWHDEIDEKTARIAGRRGYRGENNI